MLRDMRPEVPRVVRAAALARDRERLARITRSDDVHRVAPWAAVEGGNIVPDNSLVQGRVFHPRHEDGRGVGVPLDMTHSAISGACEVQPEIEPACAGAEREPEQARVAVSGRHAGGR
jgi:hypothetical protein